MTTKPIKPPAGLSKEAGTLWSGLTSEYEISDAAGLAIVGQAVESLPSI